MDISDFDYHLPDDLIAQHPLLQRDASRMLILDRAAQSWRDSHFKNLPSQLSAGDVLVVNNTRVFPARLRGNRVPSGGSIELLLIRETAPKMWEALARPARRLRIDDEIEFAGGRLRARVTESRDNGIRVIKFDTDENLDDVIDRIGEPPLPPYIKSDGRQLSEDQSRYQTVYAASRGAIAAPTAGLHFTPSILEILESCGVRIAQITLHVGYGTFEPVRVRDVSEHQVAPERFSITETAAHFINEARLSGNKVVAVGTTTARALESAASPAGDVKAQSGQASLTIVPGYQFRVVDGLLTNFHLPQSSLLMLVSAFAKRELVLRAYEHAVKERYRFYSYGDCMLLI
ncbi:MAG TPA: tRNA preQ1(34) S-adenosylmethionine ribosyltransferase-isomerase QueA [Blastocatellia bacterium]|nr:tRNA preQ1(34) S-adenosylmethionine ribosyltransferase-isomerase QueA [Blastocatellia bacterium]